MGCKLCKEEKVVTGDVCKPKEYSWDKRGKVDLKDFTISNLKDEDVCRLPGLISGQQLMIQNCTNSSIFALDNIDSINIDDCTNCKIVLGPVKGSVFIRDCVDCTLVVPCGQFRSRDSHQLDIFLYCATQPIIESSTHVRFSCIRMQYNELSDQLKVAGLSIYNNLWSSVHDFTPIEGESNWRKMPDTVRLQDFITPPFLPQLKDVGWSISGKPGIIPISHGLPTDPDLKSVDICLVLVFGTINHPQGKVAELFLSALSHENNQCKLLTSREVELQSGDAAALQLSFDLWKNRFDSGPVVGLVIGGRNSYQSCTKIMQQQSSRGQVYVNEDPVTASKQVSSFLQCASMHLGF